MLKYIASMHSVHYYIFKTIKLDFPTEKKSLASITSAQHQPKQII